MFQVYRETQGMVEAVALTTDAPFPTSIGGREFKTGSTVAVWDSTDTGTNPPKYVKIYDANANTWRILYQN